ncbi:hypothetical protein CEE37_10865 [candidate division LCP-89 bacterium B3_LCP]|uniref:Transglycosylase SLT domain-containing protein n=1 Tax=candidate division LCP-89 bacterium B3_LCP TaxID=2012998 RepID=A0A532UXU6_UNCL8|nr:MAG: hypothetical protein CEE37_10865 [candidate division LCP-89 bacterium B3_LCP]
MKTFLLAFLIHVFCYVSLSAKPHGVDPAFESLVTKIISDGGDSLQVVTLFQDSRIHFVDRIVSKNMIPRNNPADYQGFLVDIQIEEGRRFLQTKKTELDATLKDSKIPAEIIVAILKVESNLGRRAGKIPVLAVFATISSLNNPRFWQPIADTSRTITTAKLKKRAYRRSKWAYRELTSFFEACEVNNWNPLEINGSWAGAFGWAQFLPSSYLSYARDGNGDAVIDPYNLQDAVASIACYLKKSGWGISENSMRRAIHRYNPSSAYVDCIIEYAHRLKEIPTSGKEDMPGAKSG